MKKTSFFDGLPKALQIGPYLLPLRIVDDCVDSDNKSDSDAVGMYRWGRDIQIKRDQQNSTFAADTVIHEILHALYKNLGIDHFTSEEQLVGSISTGLTQVLKDSPGLRKWLHKTLT